MVDVDMKKASTEPGSIGVTESLGQRINDQLQEKQLTISQLSDSLKVSRQSLYKWINKNQISDNNLSRLSDFFGVSPAWLKYGDAALISEQTLPRCEQRLGGGFCLDQTAFVLQATGALSMEWGLNHSRWQWQGNAKEVLGIAVEQLPTDKQQFLALLDANDTQRFETSWSNVLSNQGVEQIQCLLHLSGVSCRVLLSLRMSAGRNQMQMVVCSMEVLKHYQQQLKHYEKQENLAQKLSGVTYWDWDVVRDRFTGCLEVLHQLGHQPTRAEANKEGILRYLHPDDRAMFSDALDRAVASKSAIDVNIRLLKVGGEHQLYHCLADVELDHNGEVLALAGVSKNITDQSRLQQDHQLLEQRCIDLQARTSSEGSMIIDGEGHIVDACRGVALQLGYGQRQELIGKHVYQLFDMHSYAEHLGRLSSSSQPLSFKSFLYDKQHQRQACKVRVYDSPAENQQKLMTVLLEDIGVRER